MHCAWPPRLKVPATHREQLMELAAEKEPLGHATHSVEPAAAAAEEDEDDEDDEEDAFGRGVKNPERQSRHSSATARGAYLPLEQGQHSSLKVYWPGVQSAQKVRVMDDSLPSSQVVHALRPGVPEKVPLGQRVPGERQKKRLFVRGGGGGGGKRGEKHEFGSAISYSWSPRGAPIVRRQISLRRTSRTGRSPRSRTRHHPRS